MLALVEAAECPVLRVASHDAPPVALAMAAQTFTYFTWHSVQRSPGGTFANKFAETVIKTEKGRAL